MPAVEVPGLGIVEFPDGTPPEAMTRAIQQALGQQREQRRAELVKSDPGQYDPNSPEFQRRFGPTGSALENAAAGAGAFLNDARLGLKQLGAQALDAIAPRSPSMSQLVSGENPRRAAAVEREIRDTRQLNAPLMNTTGGKVGYYGGGAAFSAPLAAIPGANTYAGATLIGGGLGAVQPVLDDESRALNTALGAGGGAAGQKVGNVLAGYLARPSASAAAQGGQASGAAAGSQSARVGSGTASAQTTVGGAPSATVRGGGWSPGSVGADPSAGLTRGQTEILGAGREMGMRVTPGVATGSRALQQFEAKLESQPMTSGPFNTIRDNNQRITNRAAAAAIGENSDVVDSTVLAQARDRLKAGFEAVADERARGINPDEFLGRVAQVEDEFEGLLPRGQGITQHELVQRLFRYAESGQATGEQLHDLSSKLGNAAANQMTSAQGDRQLGMALFRVKELADDLLEQGLDDAQAEAFRQTRQQYRNLALLTTQTNVVNPSSGNVNARALASFLQRKDKGGFLYGANDSDLYTAARFAQAFPPVVGDSGTATRMGVTGPIEAVLRAPFWAATKAYTSSPSVALAQGLAAGGRAAGGAAQQAAEAVNPIIAPWMAPVGSRLGALLAPQLGQ